MLATVSACDTKVDHDTFKPRDIPRLYMEALQVVHEHQGAEISREERHKLAMSLVDSAVQLRVYCFSDSDRQLVNWIVQDLLPQIANVIMDLVDGKYNLQISACKNCMKRGCCGIM
jgi:hypothetical protein